MGIPVITSENISTIREQSASSSTPQNALYYFMVCSSPLKKEDNFEVFNETLKAYFESLTNRGSSDETSQTVLPKSISEKLDKTFQELNYSSETAKDLATLIMKHLVAYGHNNFNISKTGEREFLTYIKTMNGSYKNLLIDEEGDIELIFLPREREKTWNKLYFKEDGLSLSRIIADFNGMH